MGSRVGVFHPGFTVIPSYGFSLSISHISSGLISFYSKGITLVVGWSAYSTEFLCHWWSVVLVSNELVVVAS